MDKRASRVGSAVQFRDLLRAEMGKQARSVDQVDLGVVVVPDLGGVEVILDSMSVPVPAVWAIVADPQLEDRVVCVATRGGQQWIAIALVRG